MSDQYKEITDAVEKYASKQHLVSYDTGYSTGYNRAIEDVLDYLFNCGQHIEGWAEINDDIIKMKK